MKMNERLSTRNLADILTVQTGLDKERAEKFIGILSSYITQGIENNKIIKVMGLGTFKIVLVRERESVHIQTGERFVIPAHHKLSFIPDKNLKEQINRRFEIFESEEVLEDILSYKRRISEGKAERDTNAEIDYEKIEPEIPVVMLDNDITEDLSEDVKNRPSGAKPEGESIKIEDEPVSEIANEYSLLENEEEDIIPELEESFEETEVVQSAYEEMADGIDVIRYEYEEVGLLQKDDEGDMAFARDKNEDTESEKNSHIEIENEKAKKKTTPLWLWFLLLPFLITAGVSIGTYAFLHYNSEKSYDNTTVLLNKNQTDTEHPDESTGSLPIGESRVSDADEPVIDDVTEDDAQLIPVNNESTDPVSSEDSQKGKPVIDWLAPSSESVKPEPKRADKPNEKIEEKNKSLSTTVSGSRSGGQTRNNKATASTVNKSGNTSAEKVIPARVRMSAGSSLTQIAMEHYGDKVFWVYIYDYNKSRIKDFNNIPVGTEVRLPQPKAYGINAKSKTSVQKARQKQSELLKWDNWDDYQ
jgi:nucleoid DNA-binding protein